MFYDEFKRRWDQAELGPEDMRDYQTNELIPFLRANPKSAAYVGMGLGKTVSILTLLSELLFEEQISKVLIIAPIRVAVQTWPTELSKWRHLLWLDYSLIRADPKAIEVKQAGWRAWGKAREDGIEFTPKEARVRGETAALKMQKFRAAKSNKPIHIVNREFLAELVAHFLGPKGTKPNERLRPWPYDCIIVDEATSFSNHTSGRFKALTRVTGRTKRVHLLSGTPAPEGIHQLFAQCYLMDQGERFGKSITAFRDVYMKQNIYTHKWEPQSGAVLGVSAKMADIAMVMKEQDYLPLDEPVVIERPIVLDPEQLQTYKEFEESSIMELEDGEFIEGVNSGALAGKLLQFASGAIYQSKIVAERKVNVIRILHSHKLGELEQLIEENPKKPLLVAYWFKSSLSRLQAEFPKAVVMDKEGTCVDAWNAGKIPLLLVHPQSAGHGLNMQLGPGHILIYYDTPASLELYMQLNKRIARFGQKKIVRIIHMVVQGTIEKVAVPRLRKKEEAQDTIIRYLRDIRKRKKA